MTKYSGGMAAIIVVSISIFIMNRTILMTHPNRLMEKIDFKNLDFTCAREIDHVPTPSAQAEALYQQARQKHTKAMAGEVPDVPLLKEAIKDYEKAARAGHWKAVRNLANIYTSGVDIRYAQGAAIKPDSDLAVRYVKQLIQMNVATGFNMMAAFANEGWGVRQDQKASLMFFRRAADLGLPEAQRQLGKKFLNEFTDLPPADRDQIKAVGTKMLACAVRQGDVDAAEELGAEYKAIADNFPYALFYYQQGAKMGGATCLFVLYEWFEEGKYGYVADPDRAQKYYSYKKRADVREGPFPELDRELPLPPAPNGGIYPPPEAGWPNEWTKP